MLKKCRTPNCDKKVYVSDGNPTGYRFCAMCRMRMTKDKINRRVAVGEP